MGCGMINLLQIGLRSICRSGMGIWVVRRSRLILLALFYERRWGVAMVNGDPVYDRIQLNIESLWSGGPFQDPVSILILVKSGLINSRGRRIMEETISPQRQDILRRSWRGSGKPSLLRQTGLSQVGAAHHSVSEEFSCCSDVRPLPIDAGAYGELFYDQIGVALIIVRLLFGSWLYERQSYCIWSNHKLRTLARYGYRGIEDHMDGTEQLV
jgi:hypothetical protein